jgi:hypothetical protein
MTDGAKNAVPLKRTPSAGPLRSDRKYFDPFDRRRIVAPSLRDKARCFIGLGRGGWKRRRFTPHRAKTLSTRWIVAAFNSVIGGFLDWPPSTARRSEN